MYYKEFLRVRTLFMWFALVIVLITALATLGHGNMTVDVAEAAPAQHHVSAISTTVPAQSNTPRAFSASADVSRPEWATVLGIAGFVAAVFATVLGTMLSCENCGHLEIAWTRPVSRIQYAARLIGVDVAAIVIMFAFTVAAAAVVVYAHGWQHYMDMGSDTGMQLARFVACPLAWYGLAAAVTASVRGKAGMIAGFLWIGASVLIAISAAPLPPLVHAAIVALNYVNPMLYGSFSSGADAARHGADVTPQIALIGLVGIASVGIVAALAQWRRLEA